MNKHTINQEKSILLQDNGIDGQQMLEMIGSLAGTISKMQETLLTLIKNQNEQNEVIIELSKQVIDMHKQNK